MLKGMAAEDRTDFAVGKENKWLLREKEDLTVMVKKKSHIKLVLCLSNVEENQTRRLDLLAVLHFLTLTSPSDLESAWKWKSPSLNGRTGEKNVQQMTRKTQILNDLSFSSSTSTS